jgi:hypothetical protein
MEFWDWLHTVNQQLSCTVGILGWENVDGSRNFGAGGAEAAVSQVQHLHTTVAG